MSVKCKEVIMKVPKCINYVFAFQTLGYITQSYKGIDNYFWRHFKAYNL